MPLEVIMPPSPPSPPTVSQDTTPRRRFKKEYQNRDDPTALQSQSDHQKDPGVNVLLKTHSDHKPKKLRPLALLRRSKTGGRSGNGDDSSDSCTNMEESFTQNQSSHSKSSSSSIGSSLKKSFRSLLLSPKRSTHSAGRRVRKEEYDCDDDESFSGRQQDDDYDEFAADDVDQDKFMLILCKELELSCDDDDDE
jgi:hypothetical protein